MALILMCGLPASGKSTFARLLEQSLTLAGRPSVVISDGGSALDATSATVSQPPSSLYATSSAEKKTRADLRTRTLRALQPDRVVICDSLNYIKGFRYELYCAAREAGAAYCVVWTLSPVDACVARDAGRADAYGERLVRALADRFEAPRAQDRWDAPLHTVANAFAGEAREKAEAVADAVGKGARRLVPTVATRQRPRASEDAFGTIDRLTRAAEAGVLAEMRAGRGAGEHIHVAGASKKLFLARECKASELRSFRRAHLNLIRMHPPRDISEGAVLDGYVDFVNAQLRTS